MEDKVLVRVRASMSGLAFDFKIPYDIQVKDITPTMKQMFCKVSEQKLPFLQRPLLFKMDGEMIAESKTFRELQIASGDLLILV